MPQWAQRARPCNRWATEYNLVLSANPAGDAPAASASELGRYMDMIAAPAGGLAGIGYPAAAPADPAGAPSVLTLEGSRPA